MEKFVFCKALETADNETEVFIGLKSGTSISAKKENIHIKEEQSLAGVVYQYVCVVNNNTFSCKPKKNIIYFELKNVEGIEIREC
jgi:hypothetical protein